MARRFSRVLLVLAVLSSSATVVAGGSFQLVEARLELARDTLELVTEAGASLPELSGELDALRQRLEAVDKNDAAGLAALLDDAKRLRRQIVLAHPALDFDDLLINRRSCHVPGHMCDQYLGCHAKEGPGLTILRSWKDAPAAVSLLDEKLPPGMTYHPDLSFDAQRVVFAFCRCGDGRLGAFFLYEAAIDGSWVRQITGTDADPRDGAHGRQTVVTEDYDPCYLPDGGIAFISTRSQQFGRCHGGRYVPSYCMYRCEADGSNLRRISFNEANEWNPSVLHDGRIVYCRWDYINRHDTRFQSLWVTRPDGTGVAHYYGNYSSAPCMITEARAIPNSHKVVATGTDHHGYTAGSILVVDPRKGEDGAAPLLCVTPELPSPEGGLPRNTAMAPQPLPGDAPGGRRRAASPYPLCEDLFLVAYSHENQFAIYLIDTLGGRELIYGESSTSCFNPIPLRPTPTPPVLSSQVAGKEDETTGRFYVQDVYRSSEPLERGTIARLRVNEIISQPTRSHPVRSRASNEIVKRVLGTVPVAGDGSAAFEAPADTPLQFQLLDENGMAVMTMRSLVYLQPGEQATCVGCHEPRNQPPLASAALGQVRFHKIEPPAGPDYEGGFSFMRSVQPVLDRYCIDCHGLEKTERNVNLLGERSGNFTRSYDALTSGNLVRIAHRNGETSYSQPKDYFAHAGRLAGMLLDGHPGKDGKPRVQLDPASFERIINWLDLNVQFYGDYSFNRIEDQRPLPAGEEALRKAIAERFGPELAAEPYSALVNVALPAESRILKAALSEKAGGWGQVADGGWAKTDEPAYREMLELVRASSTPREHLDKAGTCGRDQGCRCGCCFVRLDVESRE